MSFYNFYNELKLNIAGLKKIRQRAENKRLRGYNITYKTDPEADTDLMDSIRDAGGFTQDNGATASVITLGGGGDI